MKYKYQREISSNLVQRAVNYHFSTKIGWPLYPADKVEKALRATGYIFEGETIIRFDSDNEKMIIATWSKGKNWKEWLISWLAK